MSETESVGENSFRMVTNAELATKLEDQEEENRLLRVRLQQLENKLGEVEDKTEKVTIKINETKGKEVVEEDDTPELDPIIPEEPFLRAIKALGGKSLERVPLFCGKMEPEVVMEWIEGLENHFECDEISEAQKVKVAKSRLRGAALTWWKFIQEERKKEGKNPIATWKGMLAKVRESYIPEDYENQLHKRRQNLRQRELDVSGYTEECQNLSLRSKVMEDESIKVARYLNGLRWNIKEELSLLCLSTVHKYYQLALKVEEKIKKKQEQSNRGRGRGRHGRGHRGSYGGRSVDQR
ncbi:hypothetical protein SUGI_0545980 [Cryptomeria japonica]|nr:hypothetical protein SUGI_0545980 [Cryptomeria japonica]